LDRVQKEKNGKEGGREEGWGMREWGRDRREGKKLMLVIRKFSGWEERERERKREKPYFYKKS